MRLPSTSAAVLHAAACVLRGGVVSMAGSPPQRTPLQPDSLALLFPAAVMRLQLSDGSNGVADPLLPPGTLRSLREEILRSWRTHVAEQEGLPEESDATTRRRATDDEQPVRARTPQEMNEEFYYFQRRTMGVTNHFTGGRGWLGSAAARELMLAVTSATAGYLERIADHSGLLDADAPPSSDWGLDPDKLHIWASVHDGGSTHPRHVHVGAAVSCVFYLHAPPGSGSICFFDPRGDIPPFERQIRHEPRGGDLLLFPPWLSHSVASSDTSDAPTSKLQRSWEEHSEGEAADEPSSQPRISISFNYVDEELEGGRGRYTWGEATAGLDVVTIEDGLGLMGGSSDLEGELETVDQTIDSQSHASEAREHLAWMGDVLASDEMRAVVLEARRPAESGATERPARIGKAELHGLLARVGFEIESLMAEISVTKARPYEDEEGDASQSANITAGQQRR